MSSYLFTKKAAVKIGSRVYNKDQIISDEEAGEENVKRLLRKGYIRAIGVEVPAQVDTQGKSDEPFYLTQTEFLTPEQVNKLTKPQLLEYAAHINFVDINPTGKAADMKKEINDFIKGATFDDSEDEDEDAEAEQTE